MELRIKELCREKGLRMSDIAEKMGINQANLASSLKGNPTLSRLQDVANVLDVEICELFKTPTNKYQRVNGYVEINGEVQKIQTSRDWLKATEKIGEIAEPRNYEKLSELRKDVASYVHKMIKQYDSGLSLSGRIGRHELFTLSCSEEIIPDSEKGEINVKNFHLVLVKKKIALHYSTLEFGYEDCDVDGDMGLVKNIINDIEWPLESSDSSDEFWESFSK